MVKKPTNWWLMAKMAAIGGAVCVGGPAFVMWVSPTDEELVKKYNPDLQKRSREGRYERQKEFDDYVTKLKEYSKSDKPIWVVQEEARQAEVAKLMAEKAKAADQKKQEMEEIKRASGLPTER
ncbi:hypothetical protein B0T18DRAFT_323456 [Schizothecium vesticola]|uniref:Cytochrome b mRNA-processing protein 4 n=1 Tax=Schizothecium vesticola TaxID=314040 RepID=A0AA40F137_9PEZI|nr:hypothetical protein B0T18DRAFT_323456 [Schizothecium vesticola]